MIFNSKKAAVIAAHPDDEILGCGATIKKLTMLGCDVNVLLLSEGLMARKNNNEEKTVTAELSTLRESCLQANRHIGVNNVVFKSFPDNRFDSVSLLDIVKEIEGFLRHYPSSLVFTHHRGDLNIDHQLTNRAVLTACRPISVWSPDIILSFDILSSTAWYFGSRENYFIPNLYVDISSTLADKINAMSCYESEIKDFPFARSLESIRKQAGHLGSIVNMEAAEGFEIIRAVSRYG